MNQPLIRAGVAAQLFFGGAMAALKDRARSERGDVPAQFIVMAALVVAAVTAAGIVATFLIAKANDVSNSG